MTRRAFIGVARGVAGLYVSPPGVDAVTASTSLLLLNMSSAVAQILMTGALAFTPQTIPIGLPVAPLVFITNNSAKVLTGNSCFFRPWPATESSSMTALNVGCAVTASNLFFLSIGGSGVGCNFVVVRQPTP